MKFNGFAIPVALFSVPPAARLVYLSLVGEWARQGGIGTDAATLSAILGFPKEQIRGALDALRQKRLVVADGTKYSPSMSSCCVATMQFDSLSSSLTSSLSSVLSSREGLEEGESEGKKPLPPSLPTVTMEQVVAMYHELLPELPRVAVLSAKRRAALKQRMSSKIVMDNQSVSADTPEFWGLFFRTVRRSRFLMGEVQAGAGHRNWRASFDFLLSPNGFAGVVEGKYED